MAHLGSLELRGDPSFSLLGTATSIVCCPSLTVWYCACWGCCGAQGMLPRESHQLPLCCCQSQSVVVQSSGARDWSTLAQQMPARDGKNRSGKSCRLRWCNQLDPNVSKAAFSEWEIAVIVLSQRVRGRWPAAALTRGHEQRVDGGQWGSK